MLDFPVPSNENKRLAELQRLRSNEWGVCAALNELCKIASRILGTPMAQVSLVGEEEQIFVGKAGLDSDRTSREVAFCAHTIMTSRPLIVEDAESDPRFCKNPLVTGELGIKSYLGIPLETSPGLRIGALCVVDKEPRRFKESDVQTLTGLAQIVVSVINSYHAALELDDQLTHAIALQNGMLPSAALLAQIQAHCPLELSSFYKARDGIGGDIWGIEHVGPQCIMIYVADFIGHGVAAALNTARFHSFVHIFSQRTAKPGSLLRRLNRRLHEVLPVSQFATMFCAMIDFKAQIIEYASAGAPPQLYRRSREDPFEIISQPSLPLGIVHDVAYESETVPFLPGGVLVLYTDGLVETPKPPRNYLTTESMREHLNKTGHSKNSYEMRESLVSEVFPEPALKADDDITLIIAQHTVMAMEPIVDYEI